MEITASSSSATSQKWAYDVFLSFRGEDTRSNFVDHLYTALNDRSIYTFKDDPNLKRGKCIPLELLKAIEESRFSVVIFSRNYADSSWCLDELAKIIDCKRLIGQTVLPVFYYVDPSEVRKQSGCFRKAFEKHEFNGDKDKDQIQRWRNSLTEAAKISGWTLPNTANGYESKCIKQIVGHISMNLSYITSSSPANNLIGIESRAQNVKFQLLTGSNGVEILGILGMGGMGKTTLARVVFDDLSKQFEGRSFVANVREVAKSSGLQYLQEKILSEILMERKLKIPNVHEGIIMMSRLCRKRVLLVLDDVDNVNQLEALAGKRDWFGDGSRIIITTRDEHLLVVHGVNKIHKAVLLDDVEAHLLFNRYAFKDNNPPEECVELSDIVVSNVGGLPLALKVFGSFLYGRSVVEWKGAVSRLLKHAANSEILGVLRISFDGLERNEKDIFLDIACFFLGMEKDDASIILESFDFDPDIGLSVLIEKCLVIVSDGTLEMHDLIKELAWDIVYQMDPKDPGRRSRLWIREDVDDVLKNNTGTEAIEGIQLEGPLTKYNFLSFTKMKKLRLLDFSFCSGAFEGPGPEYLSNELRWLRWEGYPSKSLPESFQPEKLFYLSMPGSDMVQIWKGKKMLDKLKFVDLSDSASLTRIPDLSGAPNLEMLSLRECSNLKEVHPSIGDLRNITILDLYGCTSLKRLILSSNMTSLETLILSQCSKLKVFPQIHGDMERLTNLLLDGTAIKQLHPSIGKLTNLVLLDLSYCKNIRCLPITVGHLKHLETLNLSFCSRLEKLPYTLGQMESLEELLLSGSAIRQVPSSIVQLKDLKNFSFGGSKDISLLSRIFPSLSLRLKSVKCMDSLLQQSLSGFLYLKELKLVYCGLSEIPGNLSQIPSLEELTLSGNDFTCLPDSFCQFPRLKFLELKDCRKLEELVELPRSIAMLIMDNCESLKSVGDLLTSKHEWLHEVSMGNCYKLISENEHHCGNSSGLADMLSRTMLQGRSVLNHQFSILVQGRKIPDWISHKLDMKTLQYPTSMMSLELNLPPNWDKRIAGFAVCFVLQKSFPYAIVISIGRYYKEMLMFSEFDSKIFWDDHVWVGYVSLELLGKQVFGNDKEENDWIGRSEESFLHILPVETSEVIKEFGIHVVYKEDVMKHMSEEGEVDDSGSSQSSGDFGFFPTKNGVGHFFLDD